MIDNPMAITILDLALYRIQKNEGGDLRAVDSLTVGDLQEVGLPFMGGCSVCGASIAAYNACPSKSGFLKCASGCIGSDGWETVEEADAAMFPPDPETITLIATVTYTVVEVEVQVKVGYSEGQARDAIQREAYQQLINDVCIKDGVITKCSDPFLED